MTPRPNPDLLFQADHAERNGDHTAAAGKLRAHLALRPDDGAVRLRLARLLLRLDERASVRSVLLSLDDPGSNEWAAQANRLLALLDETEGALSSAQLRWERVLADDIDDPEAHNHLRALRPQLGPEGWPATLSVGTLAAPDGVRLSRFKMIRELGRGSTAAVYLVLDERLKLPLALKVLHPQIAAASRTESREKFFAEARMAARLRHPGVVAIYGVDEAARYLVMEYVAGGTIRDRLRATNSSAADSGFATKPTPGASPHVAPLPVLAIAQILAIARSLLGALAYVHGAGIVHGDLKPGNVLLRGPTDVVLADFGVAELANAAPPTSDRPGGTPLYLAPEQFRGARPSVQTDLFATGAILWELLHGRPLRRHSDLLAGVYSAPIPAADTLTPLDHLIAALVAPEAAGRPPTAQAALSWLDPGDGATTG